MIAQFRTTLSRSADTLVEDFIGAGALAVILLGALHLPGFF